MAPPPQSEGAPDTQTASQARICQVRQRDPPFFSGSSDDDVDDWLVQYCRVSSHNAWDDDAKLANVVFFLKDTALQWFENHEAALTSWTTFCESIKKLFGRPSQRKRYAIQRLSTRAQVLGETCTCYIEDVLSLCRRADPTMTEQDKVNHILKGIAEDIFNFLAPKSPKTVTELIDECGKFEELRNRRVSSDFQRLPQTIVTSSPCDTLSLVELVRRVVAEEIRLALPPTQTSAHTRVPQQNLPPPTSIQEAFTEVTPPLVTSTGASVPTYAQVCASQPWPSPSPRTQYRPPIPRTAPGFRPYYADNSRTNVWRTPDGRPICYYCHTPGHILRYCRRRSDYYQPTGGSPDSYQYTTAPSRQPRTDVNYDDDRDVRNRRPRTPSPHPRRRRSSSPMVSPTPN